MSLQGLYLKRLYQEADERLAESKKLLKESRTEIEEGIEAIIPYAHLLKKPKDIYKPQDLN